MFSRALGSLLGFTLNSNWFLRVFPSILIGWCDYFDVGFTTLNQEALWWHEFPKPVTTCKGEPPQSWIAFASWLIIAPLHIFLVKAGHNKFSQKRNGFANLQLLNRHSDMTYSVPKQVVSPEWQKLKEIKINKIMTNYKEKGMKVFSLKREFIYNSCEN